MRDPGARDRGENTLVSPKDLNELVYRFERLDDEARRPGGIDH